MSLRVSFVILLVIFCQQLFAQEKYSISGYVRDASTGEYLIGATVLVQELPGVGSSTNTYGFYSITLEKGEYTLVINFLGLSPQTRKITLDKDLELDFNLEENSTQLNEVVISAEKADENLRKPEMGVEKIEMQDLDDIPVLMGAALLF